MLATEYGSWLLRFGGWTQLALKTAEGKGTRQGNRDGRRWEREREMIDVAPSWPLAWIKLCQNGCHLAWTGNTTQIPFSVHSVINTSRTPKPLPMEAVISYPTSPSTIFNYRVQRTTVLHREHFLMHCLDHRDSEAQATKGPLQLKSPNRMSFDLHHGFHPWITSQGSDIQTP